MQYQSKLSSTMVAIGRRLGKDDQSLSPVETCVPCSARVLPE